MKFLNKGTTRFAGNDFLRVRIPQMMSKALEIGCSEMKLQWASEGVLEAGVDEAGRGCLAGPVFAAAVILPANFPMEGIRDSKILSHDRRMYYRRVIEENAVAWAVAYVDNVEIDDSDILRASVLAMHRSLEKLKVVPHHILVDGNYFIPWRFVPYTTVVRGDRWFANIAAASILAKTYRDEWMCKLHEKFPHYHWNKNKGYPTQNHRQSIRIYGPSPYHRKSFKLL